MKPLTLMVLSPVMTNDNDDDTDDDDDEDGSDEDDDGDDGEEEEDASHGPDENYLMEFKEGGENDKNAH